MPESEHVSSLYAPQPGIQSSGPSPVRRIAVLTGGPGSGKTTLLHALAASGVATIPEAAIQLIEELNIRLGIDGQRAWRREHFAEFQELLIDRQLLLEKGADSRRCTVADRGLLDIVGFCLFKRVSPPTRLQELTRSRRYSVAFVLGPLPTFVDRRQSGRVFSGDESLAIGECLNQTYADAGVQVIKVPFMTISERTTLVLEKLAKMDCVQ